MDVSHIATLAGLTLSPEEVKKFTPQLEETLKTIEVINELDTSDILPTDQVTGLVNVMREDIVDTARILPVEVALSQAASRQHNFFVINK